MTTVSGKKLVLISLTSLAIVVIALVVLYRTRPDILRKMQLTAPQTTGTVTPTNEVVRHSETHFTVPEAFLKYELSNLNGSLSTMRAVPLIEKEKFSGFLIEVMDETSPFRKLGLLPGDKILKINDVKLDGPSRGLDAFREIQGASSVYVVVKRGARELTIQYDWVK